MGGSGGGGFFSGRSSPEELRRKLAQESESESAGEAFRVEVTKLIDGILADANSRDAGAVRSALDSIKSRLEQFSEGSLALRLGGSVAKRTSVEGLSDVDALVILNQSELADKTPHEVLEFFGEELRRHVGAARVGDLAVTVSVDNNEIQLIPALRTKTGLRIPGQGGRGWSDVVQPEAFAAKLTDVNQKMAGKVIPVIKLAKIVLSQMPEARRLDGYHIESLAVQYFSGYKGELTSKAMLQSFIRELPRIVQHPVRDLTGQSDVIDDHLGPSRGLQRRMVADSIERVGRTMEIADLHRSIAIWKELLAITEK